MLYSTISYEHYLERMRKLAHDLEYDVERVESYELLDEGLRLWRLIKSILLKSAKSESLGRNNLVEIIRKGNDSIVMYINRNKAREVKSYKIKKNISFYSLMLRLAILAEPYGLKVVSHSTSNTDERWVIDYIK